MKRFYKVKRLVSIFALAGLWSGMNAQVIIFDSPCEGTLNPVTKAIQTDVPHRIPAICETSNNEILVFADKRWGYGDVGQSDIPLSNLFNNGAKSSQIDQLVKRSSDYGQTWQIQTDVVYSSTTTDYACGDPAVVVNEENRDEILCMTASGNIFFTQSENANNQRLQISRHYSKDAGKTWEMKDITTDIYGIVGYDGIFFTSGRILMSSYRADGAKYNRIYAALATNNEEEGKILGFIPYNLNIGRTVVVYSDDFGATWGSLGVAIEGKVEGSIIATSYNGGGDEGKCEELPNGNILVSAKINGAAGRKFNIYDVTNNKWLADGGVEYTNFGSNSASTNGEILIVPVKDNIVTTDRDEADAFYLLQSLPTAGTSGSARANVKIFWKKLTEADYTNVTTMATTGWCSAANAYPLSTTESAYSTMILQSDGNIGVAWEEDIYWCGQSGWLTDTKSAFGYNIKYKNIPPGDIIDGILPESPESPETPVVSYLEKKINSCADNGCTYSRATLYVPYAVTIQDDGNDIWPYIVTKVNTEKKSVTIKKIETKVIPANTPVVLFGNKNNTSSYTTKLIKGGEGDVTLFEGSMLQGSHSEIRWDGAETVTYKNSDGSTVEYNYKDYFVLGHGSKGVGFYYPNSIAAYSAFVKLNDAAAVKSFSIIVENGDATAIEEAEIEFTEEGEPVVYDLSGRRVNDLSKPGIYIKNGKKFIVK